VEDLAGCAFVHGKSYRVGVGGGSQERGTREVIGVSLIERVVIANDVIVAVEVLAASCHDQLREGTVLRANAGGRLREVSLRNASLPP
jgi:hypothetical protein